MARKAAAQAAETPQIAETPTPLIGPVDVELEPEVTLPEEAVVETAPQPSEPVPQPTETPKSAEDPALLRRLQEAEEAARRNADVARQWEQHAKTKEQERQAQEWVQTKRLYDAQYDSVVNFIGAAQSKLEALGAQYAEARNNGDAQREFEIQAENGKLNAQIERYEFQKGQMENWLEANQPRPGQQPRQQQPQQRQQQPQQQPQRPPTREEAIVGVEQWDGPPRAKQWLKDNLEYMMDPRKNAALQSVHAAVIEQGVEQFSDDYYERVEAALLGKKSNGNGQQQPANQSQQRSAAPVSAPPTREAPSMSTGKAPVPTKVTLNAEEREMAAAILASRPDLKTQAEAEKEYARQKLRMLREKAANGGQ